MRTLEAVTVADLSHVSVGSRIRSVTSESSPPRFDKNELRSELESRDRWPDAIASITGCDPSILDGGHHECPRCGGHDRFNLSRDGSGAAFCNQCPDGQCVASDGFGTIQWLTGMDFLSALNSVGDFCRKESQSLPSHGSPAKHPQESASRKPVQTVRAKYVSPTDDIADLRHCVYSAMAGEFGMSDKHREAMHARGLTSKEIDDGKYFSLPAGFSLNRIAPYLREFPTDLSQSELHRKFRDTVPGAMGASVRDSLAIPYRDPKGRIVGIRLRADEPGDGPKYTWLSSAKKGGPGGGGLPAHVPVCSGVMDYSTIRITEGEIKADTATSRTGILTLSVPGVASWPCTIPLCEGWQPKEIRLAFDMDAKENVDVSRKLTEMWKHYTTAAWSPDVRVETWEEVKGIDDAIASGKQIKRLTFSESADYIQGLQKKHGLDVPKLHELLDDLSESEEPDDPARLARLNVERFRERHGGRLAYWRGQWWKYRSGCWRKLMKDEIDTKIRSGINQELFNIADAEQEVEDYKPAKSGSDGKPNEKTTSKTIKKKRASNARVKNVVGEMEPLCRLSNSIEMPSMIGESRKRQFLSLRNGAIDLEEFIWSDGPTDLSEHTSNWFSGLQLQFDFDTNAKCLTWEAYLDDAVDEYTAKLIQEWTGYTLYAGNPFQRFCVLEGDGGTGKSVCAAALTAFIGVNNISNVSLDGFGGNQFSLTDTIGKSLNIDSDTNERARFNIGLFKKFSTGERFQVEYKGVDPMSVEATAKVMLIWNNRPGFSDASNGLWRRMLLAKFERIVPENRKILSMDKPWYWIQSGELPGMLNWALDGLRRLFRQGGFTTTDAMQIAIDRYRNDQNPVDVFLADAVSYDAASSRVTPTSQLVAAYRRWAEDSTSDSDAQAMSPKKMSAAVYKKFKISSDRHTLGGKRCRGFLGLTIDAFGPESEAP